MALYDIISHAYAHSLATAYAVESAVWRVCRHFIWKRECMRIYVLTFKRLLSCCFQQHRPIESHTFTLVYYRANALAASAFTTVSIDRCGTITCVCMLWCVCVFMYTCMRVFILLYIFVHLPWNTRLHRVRIEGDNRAGSGECVACPPSTFAAPFAGECEACEVEVRVVYVCAKVSLSPSLQQPLSCTMSARSLSLSLPLSIICLSC